MCIYRMEATTVIIANIIELALKIVLLAMEGQPPEVRAELWRIHLEDVKAWRTFFDKLKPEEWK